LGPQRTSIIWEGIGPRLQLARLGLSGGRFGYENFS